MLSASDWAWYNALIWPAPIFAYLIGIVTFGLVFMRFRHRYAVITSLLALFWIGEVVTFGILAKRILDPVTILIMGIFLAQAAILLAAGLRGRIHFGFSGRLDAWVGVLFVAYALVGYPVVTALLGHPFPDGPAFGVAPCPVIMFTLGMLLLTDDHLPRHVIVIPGLLGILGLGSGLMFGAAEDLPLAIAGPLAAYLIMRRTRPGSTVGAVVEA